MQMNDSRRVAAPKDKVWAALNDAEILKRCIPGCQSLEMNSPTEMSATVVVRVGPVKATFAGKVNLSDLDPPNGYHIAGEGSGGVAGFAKGGATVKLEADGPQATNLNYAVDAQIGGKLAQLGGRLIDATAKKLAGEFFENLAAALSPPIESGPPPPTVAAAAPVEAAPAADAKVGWFKRLIAPIVQRLSPARSDSRR
jgi:hypothetical protein